eukprot:scaffold105107_cov25-Tisochrysis_lutea.AAC.5
MKVSGPGVRSSSSTHSPPCCGGVAQRAAFAFDRITSLSCAPVFVCHARLGSKRGPAWVELPVRRGRDDANWQRLVRLQDRWHGSARRSWVRLVGSGAELVHREPAAPEGHDYGRVFLDDRRDGVGNEAIKHTQGHKAAVLHRGTRAERVACSEGKRVVVEHSLAFVA